MNITDTARFTPSAQYPIGRGPLDALGTITSLAGLTPIKQSATVELLARGARDLGGIKVTPTNCIAGAPQMVFLPGLCQTPRSYLSSIALPIAQEGYRVVIAGTPQRDHDSGLIRGVSIEEQALFAKQCIDAAGQSEKMVLVTHSHGDHVARRLIADHGLRPNAIVSIAPEPVFGLTRETVLTLMKHCRRFIAANVERSFVPLYDEPRFIANFMINLPLDKITELRQQGAWDDGSFKAYLRALVPDFYQAVRTRNQCPDITVLRCGDDKLFSEAMTRMHAKMLGAKYAVIDNAPHLIQFAEPAVRQAIGAAVLSTLQAYTCAPADGETA